MTILILLWCASLEGSNCKERWTTLPVYPVDDCGTVTPKWAPCQETSYPSPRLSRKTALSPNMLLFLKFTRNTVSISKSHFTPHLRHLLFFTRRKLSWELSNSFLNWLCEWRSLWWLDCSELASEMSKSNKHHSSSVRAHVSIRYIAVWTCGWIFLSVLDWTFPLNNGIEPLFFAA